MIASIPEDAFDDLRAARRRFIFCTISAVVFCIGVIIGVCGLMIHILSINNPTSISYLNEQIFFRNHPIDEHNRQTLTSAIVMGSIGVVLIFLALIFAVMTCFAGHSCFIQKKRPSKKSITQVDSIKNSDPEDDPLTAPLIDCDARKPVSGESESTSPKRLLQNRESPVESHGDINMVGLPAIAPSHHRVPPNGFSYLAHPSEIHSYHVNRNTPLRPQPAPRSNLTGNGNRTNLKHESAI